MTSIGEILAAKGRALADARRERANVWTPTVQQLANLPGQIMQDRAAERAAQVRAQDEAQAREVRQQQIDEGKRKLAAGKMADEDEQAMTTIFSSPGILDETGTVDIHKAIGLAQQQAPRLVPRLMKAAQEHDEGVQKAALTAAQTAKANMDVENTQTDRRQLRNKAEVQRMIGMALAARNGQPLTPQDRQTYQGMALQEGIELPKDITTAPEPAKGPTLGSFEDYITRTYGPNPTPAQIVQGRKVYQQADDRPITINTSATGTVPGNWDLTGDQFLQSIPAQWRQTVKKIANYDEDPTKVASMRGGMRETLMQWVNQVNPAYDASQFSNRAPTRKAFTTGTQGQQINAINTAIGHIDQVTGLMEGLGNSSFTPANQKWNTLRTMFGSDKVTNFDTLKDALAGEVASILSKSGATVSGIAEAKEKISAANSPAQLAGYFKTLIPVMGSKLAAFNYQYHQAMGEDDAFSALSTDSKRILEKHGFDPEHPTLEQGGNMPTEGTQGTVNGVPAVWKTVDGKAGWYAR